MRILLVALALAGCGRAELDDGPPVCTETGVDVRECPGRPGQMLCEVRDGKPFWGCMITRVYSARGAGAVPTPAECVQVCPQ